MTKLNDVVFPLHQDNVSFSRIPNATGPFEFTTNLTPLQNNDFVTSVDEHQAKHIQLYPNPTSGAIHIASELKIARMALYDNRGTLIFDTTEAIHELPVQNLQAGLYILILQSEGETITKRFLKK
jgi:hypothetical protein